MPRPLRVQYPHAWYHVMNRGSGRQKIFKNDLQRIIFLELLGACCEMYNAIISAYCLMDNHYHILLSTPDANLSQIMRHINGVYTKKYNRMLKTDGALFRGRYKAQLIEDNCYQLIVSRYIHLNPVDAGLVSNPAEYKWSSYRAYLGLTKSPHWLSKNIIIDQLAGTKLLSHVKNYHDYVENKLIEDINIFSSKKQNPPIIGSELFKENILSKIEVNLVTSCSADVKRIKLKPAIDFIKEQVCSYYKINSSLMICSKRGMENWPKKVFMYLCKKKFGYTLHEISLAVGFRRYESVSSVILKCETQIQQDPALYGGMEDLVARIKSVILGTDKLLTVFMQKDDI